MSVDVLKAAKTRYTAKAFDPSKRIPDGDIAKLKELLQLAPSSINIQPWHFLLVSSDTGKAKVAKATDAEFPFNTASVLDASHVVVFCTRLMLDDAYMQRVLDQEDRDGRYARDPETLKPQMGQARAMFCDIHRHDLKDVQHWMDKQVYLNLGQFLIGVASLGIDARPMEGFDIKMLDHELGLRDKGYTSLVVVPLGYSAVDKDYNAQTPKSRLPLSYTLTEA